MKRPARKRRRWRWDPSVARCRHCSKKLVWFEPAHDYRRVAGKYRMVRRHRKPMAFRCVHCWAVLCRPCANRHFAPIRRVERAVERQLETIAVGLMREATKRAKPCRRART